MDIIRSMSTSGTSEMIEMISIAVRISELKNNVS